MIWLPSACLIVGIIDFIWTNQNHVLSIIKSTGVTNVQSKVWNRSFIYSGVRYLYAFCVRQRGTGRSRHPNRSANECTDTPAPPAPTATQVVIEMTAAPVPTETPVPTPTTEPTVEPTAVLTDEISANFLAETKAQREIEFPAAISKGATELPADEALGVWTDLLVGSRTVAVGESTIL